MLKRAISAALAAVTLAVSSAGAQNAPAAQIPQTPRAAAPIDLTGNWVAVVTEEWRWRMMTPPKGDYISVPLSDEGRRVADTWEPAKDGACQAYGAGGIMWLPTRLQIAWADDRTLKVDADAGTQTRRLAFDGATDPGPPSLQGRSLAAWEPIGGAPVMRNGVRIAAGAPQGGALKVVTTNLREGWLRRNGIAYSESTTITEYWDRVLFPNGDAWLIVTSILSDSRYLLSDYTRSAHFKLEPDGSKWHPTPCRQL